MDNNYVENITKRYVYDVTRRLPQNQRLDIEKELHTLIEDMLCERIGDNPPANKDIDIVLMELGDPMELANKYRDEKRCLISGEYYESYIFILKIVLSCVTFGIIIANIVSIYTNYAFGIITRTNDWAGVSNNIAQIIANLFSDLFSAVAMGFTWVTIIFAVIQRRKHRVTLNGGYVAGEWAPNNLPHIPNQSEVIRKSDCIAGIVFGILVIIMFSFIPQILGVWTDKCIIPIFNMTIWNQILPLFIGCCVLGLVRDTTKLVVGKYGNTVMLTTIITNVLGLIITIVLFTCFNILNPNLASELQNAYNVSFTGVYGVFNMITTGGFIKIFLGIVVFAFAIDIFTVTMRTIKANRILA